MTKQKRIMIAFAITSLITVLIGYLGLTYFFGNPWIHFKKDLVEIDINSGMTRTTRYNFWIKQNEKISNTSFSSILEIKTPQNPDWRTSAIYTNFRHVESKTDFAFHTAPSQGPKLKDLSKKFGLNKEETKTIAQRIMKIWHEKKNSIDAEIYLSKVEQELSNKNYSKPSTSSLIKTE